MNTLEFAPRFKQDHQKARKHPEYARDDLVQLLADLMQHDALPAIYREHTLEKRAVNWAGFSECHLSPDLVVIYRRSPGVVKLHRMGSHASVFKAGIGPR